MNSQRSIRVHGVGRITKALSGYYPGELQALAAHYLRVGGIAPGHLDYERFVILGQERTGSTFLQGLLSSHSEIVAFGEIFRQFDAIGWGYASRRRRVPGRELAAFQDDPVSFLETHVFAKFARGISAVGFKLFYTHSQHPRQESLWTYLRDHRDVKIIHIKRRNVLRTHLSLETAKALGRWTDLSGETVTDNLSVMLNYDDCLHKFADTREQESEHDILFANHDKIDLFYEELSSDYASEMRRVQQFLNVEYEVVEPGTYKMASRPLSVAISNYDELKARFRGTPWEGFFED